MKTGHAILVIAVGALLLAGFMRLMAVQQAARSATETPSPESSMFTYEAVVTGWIATPSFGPTSTPFRPEMSIRQPATPTPPPPSPTLSSEVKSWLFTTYIVMDECTKYLDNIPVLAGMGEVHYKDWEPTIIGIGSCGKALQSLPVAPPGYGQAREYFMLAGGEYVSAAANYESGIRNLNKQKLSDAADNLDAAAEYLGKAEVYYDE